MVSSTVKELLRDQIRASKITTPGEGQETGARVFVVFYVYRECAFDICM